MTQIKYLIFGFVTTVVNIVAYYIFYSICHFNNIPSIIIAWFISVLVAYVTNKLWVFESKSMELSIIGREITSFFSCRVMTGVVEVVIMWITVDVLGLRPMVMKVISNIIVIILNYIVSKLIIFRKNTSE